MGRSSNGQVSATFTPTHINRIVKALGLRIGQETVHDFVAYCPFHSNRDTPSLSISKSSGQYICFNPGCGESGEILNLVKHVLQCNDFEALRFVMNGKPNNQDEFEAAIESMLEDKDEFVVFNPEIINSMAMGLWENGQALDYMHSRGFNDDTLRYFSVGWSAQKGLISVPAFSHTGIPVGVIGRSIEGKRFKNSVGFPSSRIFYNLNRAIRHGSTAIITESSFDAMRVHQAGYSNVIANLGGYLSPYKRNLLNRYFDKIIIMTDNDKTQYNNGICRPCGGACRGHNPGRELGQSIAQAFDREVLWAFYKHDMVYPDGAKDAGDMTDDQIRTVITNAIPHFEYAMINSGHVV